MFPVVRGTILPNDVCARRWLRRGSTLHYQHDPDGCLPAGARALHVNVHLLRWFSHWTRLRYTGKGTTSATNDKRGIYD